MVLGNGESADDDVLSGGAAGDDAGALGGAPSGGGDGSAAGQQASAESYTLRDFLRSRDYDVPDTLNDDALLQQFEGWAGQAQRFAALGDADPEELQRYAELGRRLSPYEAQIEQLRQQAQLAQSAAAAAPASAGTAAGQPGVVAPGRPQASSSAAQAQQAKFDRDALEAARSTCRKNPETGLWEPLQPFYADAAKFLNDAEQVAQRNSQRLLLDPDGFIDEGFSSRAQKLREELRQEILRELQPDIESWREYRLQQMRQEFLGPIEAELVVSRDAAGNPVLTPKGAAFESAYANAPQGLSEIDRLKYAKALADQWELQQSRQPASATGHPFLFTKKTAQAAAGAAPAAAAAAKPSPAADQPRDRRGRFIDAARRSQTNGAATLPVPDRAATVRAAARRIGTREAPKTFEEIYAEQLAAHGQ